MKRLIIVLCLVAGFCSVGFAQENAAEHSSADVNYRTTSGGFWVWEDNLNGGFGEFGINLLPKEKNFVLRNCIFVQGEGSSAEMNKAVGSSIEVGGGFEFQFCQGCAFVTEFGGVQRFLVGGKSNISSNISNFPNHAPCLTIGFRTFR